MSRRIRFFDKKRGNRRTGSRTVGRVWTAGFFLVFLAFGCGALVLIVNLLIMPEWRANHEFPKTTCRVLGKRIGESRGDEGTTYRPEIHIEYTVNGRSYQAWTYDATGVFTGSRARSQGIVDKFEIGQQYDCWYDPHDPQTAVLVLGYTWFAWLMLLLPAVFIAVGGGGLLYLALNWGKSTERRAAMAQSARLEVFDEAAGINRKYPNLPAGTNLTDSPGTTLAFRLPSASPGWGLLGVGIVCLIWNGAIAVPVTMAVRGHMKGEPDWTLSLFMIPFGLVGAGLLVVMVRQLLIATGIGPTIVEISDHPLYPDHEYQVFLSQAGRLSINSLNVSLVCDEEVTYRQGTNTRTETLRVFCQEIFRREGFEIQQGLPFETRCDFQVPASAMHSFKSDHNQITWKLLVKGDVAGWPDFQRSYSLHVYPRPDGGSSV